MTFRLYYEIEKLSANMMERIVSEHCETHGKEIGFKFCAKIIVYSLIVCTYNRLSRRTASSVLSVLYVDSKICRLCNRQFLFYQFFASSKRLFLLVTINLND